MKTTSKALKILREKSDCRVKGLTIFINDGKTKDGRRQKKNDLGIKSWGWIDFLVLKGFRVVHLAEFKRKARQ